MNDWKWNVLLCKKQNETKDDQKEEWRKRKKWVCAQRSHTKLEENKKENIKDDQRKQSEQHRD